MFPSEAVEDPLLDGAFGDEVEDRDGAGLVFAPGAGDALLEFGRVPREVAVDNDAGVLEVEADAAGIGAEEKAAGRVVAEGVDLGAAFGLRHRAGVPSVADAMRDGVGADQSEHFFPLGEDDNLNVGIGEGLVQEPGDFGELWAIGAVLALDDGGGGTDHAHHGEVDHEAVLLLWGEGAADGQGGKAGDLGLVVGVDGALAGSEGDETGAVGAVGELRFDLGLATAEDKRGDASPELFQVLVAGRAAFLVKNVVVAIEAKEGAEKGGVEVVHDGAKLIEAVLDGRAGEHKCVTGAEAFDREGGLCSPILDTLGLVEHDDIGTEVLVDLVEVGDDLLVVHDGEKGRVRLRVKAKAGRLAAENQAEGKGGEAADLLLPLALERRGGDKEHATGVAEAVEQGAGGDGLGGLAEAHFVGEEGAFAEGEVEHPFALVGEEREQRLVGGVAANGDASLVIAAAVAALAFAAAGVEPRRNLLGYAHRALGGAKAGEGVVGLQVGTEAAVVAKEGA